MEDLLDKDGGRWKRNSIGRTGQEQRLEDLLDKDIKMERKRIGKAGQEQNLEDFWIRIGEDGKGRVQGEQDRSRE